MSKMLGRRIKEDPKDAKTISHKFLVRGGYIRPVSAGMGPARLPDNYSSP